MIDMHSTPASIAYFVIVTVRVVRTLTVEAADERVCE
jgi:hypothetical protein